MRCIVRSSIVAGLACVTAGVLATPADASGEWVIRVSQESAPGALDFNNNVLGFVKPFEVANTCGVFYGYDAIVSGYTGCHIILDLQPDRTHALFVAAETELQARPFHPVTGELPTPSINLVVIHDAFDDPDGGIAEMMFEILDDPDGACWTVRDEPGGWYGPGGGNDEYSGDDGDLVFTSAQSWSACCSDGLALGDLEGTVRARFTNVDGNPETATIAGLTEWVVYSLDGTEIPLFNDEGRAVQFDVLPTCGTDINGDGVIDVSDLLMLLASWGSCPTGG